MQNGLMYWFTTTTKLSNLVRITADLSFVNGFSPGTTGATPKVAVASSLGKSFNNIMTFLNFSSDILTLCRYVTANFETLNE
eukprot:5616696-Ditylum_brightwellii.AAC.1